LEFPKLDFSFFLFPIQILQSNLLFFILELFIHH